MYAFESVRVPNACVRTTQQSVRTTQQIKTKIVGVYQLCIAGCCREQRVEAVLVDAMICQTTKAATGYLTDSEYAWCMEQHESIAKARRVWIKQKLCARAASIGGCEKTQCHGDCAVALCVHTC